VNDVRLTDEQLARALRATLPAQAQPGLGARIVEEAASTPQRRPLPMPFAALADLDPGAQRRVVLLAAALLLALAVVGTALVGSLLTNPTTLPRPANPLVDVASPAPSRALTLQPPADVPALARSAYGAMPSLRPMTITAVDGDATVRIYVDGSGAIRIERDPAGSTTPSDVQILSGTSMGRLLTVNGVPSWYRQDGAISEDPRVFVFATLGGAGTTIEGMHGCEIATSEGEQYSYQPGYRWTYLGADTVAGRPAYHLRCGERDLWLDRDTSVALRSSGPQVGADFTVVPGATHTIQVTSITDGQPPAALFEIRQPAGTTALTDDAYSCATDPICLASPRPLPSVASASAAPGPGTKALIASAQAADAHLPAFRATVTGTNTKLPPSNIRVFADGSGRYRREDVRNVGRGDESTTVTLVGGEQPLISQEQADGSIVWAAATRASSTPWPLRLPETCDAGWSRAGVDLVLGRAADHVRCADSGVGGDFWIDRETHLVVRTQDPTDDRYGTWVYEITELDFGPQPAGLFELPPGASVQP
jgi:hypothetical protein